MNEGLLKYLPSPESDKSGWPWSLEFNVREYKANWKYPKISVVIPSYNQGNFIEETIRSILLQNYPNVEIIVIDGGSNDNTVEIIRKYEKWIAYWVSEKDRGQSHAINKGFEKATGDLIVWQNSDDLSAIGSFYEVASVYQKKPSADVYFGHAQLIDEDSNITHTLYYVPFWFYELKYYGWNITNQSCFFNGEMIKQFRLDESYKYAMDGEFFFRVAAAGRKFHFLNKVLGQFRVHDAAKSTLINNSVGIDEWIKIRKRYNVTMSKEKQWSSQFIWQKLICLVRKNFYYFRFGIFGNKLRDRYQRG